MEYEYEVLFSDVDIDLSEEHLREKKRFISVCKSHASVKLGLAAKYGNGPPAHIVMRNGRRPFLCPFSKSKPPKMAKAFAQPPLFGV